MKIKNDKNTKQYKNTEIPTTQKIKHDKQILSNTTEY